MNIDLNCVINWIENDCDKKEAIKELRAYQKQIDLLIDVLKANEKIVDEQRVLLKLCRDALNNTSVENLEFVDYVECRELRKTLNERYPSEF